MNEPVYFNHCLAGLRSQMHYMKAADMLFLHVSQVTHMPCSELSIFPLSGRLARIYQREQLMNAKQDKDLI